MNKPNDGIEEYADKLAKLIDQEVMDTILHAGAMMSDKGYSEGSLDNPQFLESRKRYQAIFDELKNDQSRCREN